MFAAFITILTITAIISTVVHLVIAMTEKDPYTQDCERIEANRRNR